MRWWAKGGPKSYDWHVAGGPQVPNVDPGGQVLRYWLLQHPHVTANLVWAQAHPELGGTDVRGIHLGAPTYLVYDNWTDTMKIELEVAVFYAWEYMHQGTAWFNGEHLPVVPSNQLTLSDHEGVWTLLSEEDAWKLYLSTVAQSLALEIGGFVPWSIANYTTSDLAVLLNSATMFQVGYHDWQYTDPDLKVHSANGYFVSGSLAAPANENFDFSSSHFGQIVGKMADSGGRDRSDPMACWRSGMVISQ